MRILSLVLISVLFTACSTPKPVADQWASELTNKEGYLMVPPHLEAKKDFAKPEEFQRCEKIKITNVMRSGNAYYVEFYQHDKKFLMSGLGGTTLISDKAHALKMFAESFVTGPVQTSLSKKLPFDPKEKVTYQGQKTPLKDLMCTTPTTWHGMKKEHFFFVMGHPIAKPEPTPARALASASAQEYVYMKREPATYFKSEFNATYNPNKAANYHYYYFKHGKLDK